MTEPTSEFLVGNPTAFDRRIDIIGRLKKRAELGKDAERRLCKNILGDLKLAAHAPIADIAIAANVSEPTVTRLARAVGLSGTRELKFHIAQALAVGEMYLKDTAKFAAQDHEFGQVITKVLDGAHTALDLAAAKLDSSDLSTAAKMIANAGQTLTYGTGGGSSMAAVEVQNRLFRLGLFSTSYIDPQLQRMSASVLNDKTVIIAFSVSGFAGSVVDAVSIARQYGAKTIAVTSPDSPLAQIADVLFPLEFTEGEDLYKPSSVRYSILAIVDFLAMSVAEAIGPEVIEPLRRVRQSLVVQKLDNPQLPIGD